MLKNSKLQSQRAKSAQQVWGTLGEQKATEYLKKHGYTILERNWHKKYAEIDIVALDGDTLVCVEVRTRSSSSQETPEESISYHKLNTLIRSIELYKSQHPELPDALRIDLVAVTIDKGAITNINLIKSISE